jgi:hypothetical protein
MGHRSKIIKEWVEVKVLNSGDKVEESFEVDKHASKIIGILLTTDYDDVMYFRGSQKISINEKEIYPEGYESKALMQGINVAVNDRIIKLGEELDPGNRKVSLEYQDTEHPTAGFTPYRVRLYVFSRIDD